MSEYSSADEHSLDWESQSGLESNPDLGYMSERDSGSAPMAASEPAFTVIDVNDLETLQVWAFECASTQVTTCLVRVLMTTGAHTECLAPEQQTAILARCFKLQSAPCRTRPCSK